MTALTFDKGRLARLGPWMERWVASGRIPGAQALIRHRGEEVYAGWTGSRDIDAGHDWTRDTVVRIYSMTKPITTTALMMLYEDGLCHIDTPVDEVLPEMRDRQVLIPGAERLDQVATAKTRLTLHHLMTHTSGFTYGFNGGLVGDAMVAGKLDFSVKEGDLADTVRRLAGIPLLFEPGSRWNYGVSTDVLGRCVEVISGRPLAEFLAERILGPLGMHDTAFEIAEGKVGRFAACYAKTPDDPMKLMDPAKGSAFGAGRVQQWSGGGGLVGTADDYMKFAEMLRRGGRLGDIRLLSPRTVRVMMSNALPGDLASMGQAVFSEVPFDGIGFGLGGAVMLDPARAKTLGSPGDFGWGGMASTVFFIDPVEEISAIYLTQLAPSSSYPLRKEFRALVYSSLT